LRRPTIHQWLREALNELREVAWKPFGALLHNASIVLACVVSVVVLVAAADVALVRLVDALFG
jgi:preprotein translocase subunit SecE